MSVRSPTSAVQAPTPNAALRIEKLVAAFGLAQVSLFLLLAIYRLGQLAVVPWATGTLSSLQQLVFVAWVAFNMYAEGYRGFQMRFSPRVVARAVELGRNPRPMDLLLALPFCMSLIRAERRQMVTRWAFVVALYTVVFFVRMLPQPWRGILDGGVVVALAWGVGSLWWIYGQYALGRLEIPDAPVA